jgi:hypothetical protein
LGLEPAEQAPSEPEPELEEIQLEPEPQPEPPVRPTEPPRPGSSAHAAMVSASQQA